MFHLAAFGYSTPSQQLLQGSDDQSFSYSHGVHRGDPLSAVLLSLHIVEQHARYEGYIDPEHCR